MPNRSGILSLAEWATTPAVAAKIGYGPIRPMMIAPTQHDLELDMDVVDGDAIVWDCIAALKWLYRHSGSRSPDGDVDGADYGNTDTVASFLREHYTDTRKCLTGAIGIYGWPELPLAQQHGILYMEAGGQPENPWVYSMGSEKGPLKLRLADESSAHPGASCFWCSVGGL